MCFDHCQGHDDCLHSSWSLNANTWTCGLCGEQRRPAPDGTGYIVVARTCPVSIHWADPDMPVVPCVLPKGHAGQHWYGKLPTPTAIEITTRREGDWWVIDVPGYGVTQAPTRTEVEPMARDLVQVLTGRDVAVTVTHADHTRREGRGGDEGER